MNIEMRVRMAPFIHLDTNLHIYLDYRKIVGVREPNAKDAKDGYKSVIFGEGEDMIFYTHHTIAEVFELMAAAKAKHAEMLEEG